MNPNRWLKENQGMRDLYVDLKQHLLFVGDSKLVQCLFLCIIICGVLLVVFGVLLLVLGHQGEQVGDEPQRPQWTQSFDHDNTEDKFDLNKFLPKLNEYCENEANSPSVEMEETLEGSYCESQPYGITFEEFINEEFSFNTFKGSWSSSTELQWKDKVNRWLSMEGE